jgi:four helix bundle protein
MGTGRYEDLLMWQKAHECVLVVYTLTKNFPKEEIYGLTSQMRRAAVSVPANIAEGFRRKSTADKLRFYNFAQASLDECHYYLRLASDLGYGQTGQLELQFEEVSRMLNAYVDKMRRSKDS